MMLTASWHLLTMKKTHTKKNTKTKKENISKKKGFMYKGIVTLFCNVSLRILYMRLPLQRQRQRQRQDGIHQSSALFAMSSSYLTSRL